MDAKLRLNSLRYTTDAITLALNKVYGFENFLHFVLTHFISCDFQMCVFNLRNKNYNNDNDKFERNRNHLNDKLDEMISTICFSLTNAVQTQFGIDLTEVSSIEQVAGIRFATKANHHFPIIFINRFFMLV